MRGVNGDARLGESCVAISWLWSPIILNAPRCWRDGSSDMNCVPYVLLDRYNRNAFCFLSSVLGSMEHSAWFDGSFLKRMTKSCTEADDGAFLRGTFLTAA